MTNTNFKKEPRVLSILLMALGGFLLGQVLALVGDSILVALTHWPGGVDGLATSSDPPWWSNIVGLSGLWVGFALAIYFAQHRGALVALRDAWRPRPFDLTYLGLGIACQIVVGVLYGPFHFKNMNRPVVHLFGAAHGAAFVLLCLMTVVGAPVVEEWLFRGVIYRALDAGLSRHLGRAGALAAVGLSALIFALAHGEWLQLPGLFFLGVVLALLVRRTQRLLPAVLTHVGFNGLTLASLVAQRMHH